MGKTQKEALLARVSGIGTRKIGVFFKLAMYKNITQFV
jgi:hypothetical protein